MKLNEPFSLTLHAIIWPGSIEPEFGLFIKVLNIGQIMQGGKTFDNNVGQSSPYLQPNFYHLDETRV